MVPTYRIISRTQLTPNTLKIRTERPNVKIKSGQCFNVGVPGHGVNREYSMYSGADEDYLEFLIRIVEDGVVSSAINGLGAGEELEIDGPYGEFSLGDKVDSNQTFLFVASGTGVAPFHSFVKTYENLDYKVLHGIRFDDEMYDLKDYEGDRYVPCISQSSLKQSSRVTDHLNEHLTSNDIKIYLCGNRNMIVDVFHILRSRGVSGDSIFTEVFF